MRCDCSIKNGGLGRQNTPYTYHLYTCIFYLDDFEKYSYEDFLKEYNELKNNINEYDINYYFKYKYDELTNNNIYNIINSFEKLKIN